MDYQMEELLPIVSKLAQKYTGYESTSITYEKAQTLMEAVLYCINEYRSSHTSGLVYRDIPIKEQYDMGRQLLLEKAGDIRTVFNEISLRFEDFGVKCLHDTVQKGIPQFLKWYDINFCPQNTVLTLDYPVFTDCSSLSGADAVHSYIRAIRTEQQFLGAFEKNYVISVLERYNPEYGEMCENICSIILTNLIGHMAIKKSIRDIDFQDEECAQVSTIFGDKSVADIEGIVREFIQKIVDRFYPGRAYMAEYLCSDANNQAVRIYTANRHGQLYGLFVTSVPEPYL